MELDTEAALGSLRRSLEHIKALLAWEQLKQGEAGPRRLSTFQMHDPTCEQLRNEYSFFVAMFMGMRSVLGNRFLHFREATREHLRQQLADIERQINTINPYRIRGGLQG